jgi:hypothetical protein
VSPETIGEPEYITQLASITAAHCTTSHVGVDGAASTKVSLQPHFLQPLLQLEQIIFTYF